jgi:curved DNA-binding protein CbpA
VRTRQVHAVDYYADLGVRPDATPAEIAATYRTLAKALHPDARPTDPAAAERFTRVTAAYRVLADVERRRDYDERRAHGLAPVAVPEAPGTTSPPAPPPSRRGAHWGIAGGLACLVLGLAATALIISLQRHDADLRSRGEPATATVVQFGGERRLEFTTATGDVVRAPEPLRTGTGDARVGERVPIRYDPERPSQVITTEDKFARDITLWIVAVKLLVVGAFFVGWGLHRLRRISQMPPGRRS